MIKIKEENLNEIKIEMKKTKDNRYKIRLHSIILRRENYKVKDILKILSINPNTYYFWLHKYNNGGKKALENIRSGRKDGNKKWSDDIFEALFKELDKMEKHWTLPKMSEWIKENFQKEIQPKTVQKRLYKAKYSWKTNRPSPYQGDIEEQEEFKKEISIKLDKIKKEKDKPIKLFFMDEMRFGLISNFRRSWSKIGKRTVIQSQQEFENRYLFSAINPVDGESFHQIGFDNFAKESIEIFLEELKKEYSDNHLIIVWDKAPSHRFSKFKEDKELSLIFLPSYSPELNPVERFFGEIRKITANRVFPSISFQQNLIDIEVGKWKNNKVKTHSLVSYPWLANIS